jgi:hypothetical protein
VRGTTGRGDKEGRATKGAKRREGTKRWGEEESWRPKKKNIPRIFMILLSILPQIKPNPSCLLPSLLHPPHPLQLPRWVIRALLVVPRGMTAKKMKSGPPVFVAIGDGCFLVPETN